ncbi:MAG: tetratricopeptide repeat protein [Candidatus Riflebacteria bacterium]|nr:tetratricopeptide repeat protein [Candidatus Riflebacteria bacterium]
MKSLFKIISVFLIICFISCSFEVNANTATKTSELSETLSDAMIVRDAIMGFVSENSQREAGEGLLYLASHYKELKEYPRARDYLKRILRAEVVNPVIKWEAMLLDAEICREIKDYESSLKILDKLINENPARAYWVRAKVARAELWSRNLTDIEDIYEGFYKYYKPFPEQTDIEAVEYLVGFSKGYDLEIAMRAIEAWEEIAKFSEVVPANKANLFMALLYGFDLNNPKRGLSYLDKIKEGGQGYQEATFLRAVFNHYYKNSENDKYENVLSDYREFIKNTESLKGYRVAVLLQSRLLAEKLEDYDASINLLEMLREVPQHFIASESVSLEKRKAAHDETVDWGVLACKIAGYLSEYKLGNLDQALHYYKSASEILKTRNEKIEDPVNEASIRRTLPSEAPGTHLFHKAYEKYRSRKYKEALELYNEFITSYPQNSLVREALFRTAVITDDDLGDYDKALELYREYIIKYAPVKSNWNLDTLYDWSRIDEVRYRIGSLLSLHLKKPVDALDIYSQLVSVYPDSYWARQGMIDSVNLYLEELKDPAQAHSLMLEFIKFYPDTEKSKEYRLTLYKVYLAQNEGVKALHMMRDYLDHALPSDKDYFINKQKWRDLAFKIREEALRKNIDSLGNADKRNTYSNLIEVVGLASSSEPLENLINEIKVAEIADEDRWRLVYEAGIKLYTLYPDKAEKVFEDLSNSSSGNVQLACYLTLGNIAYRVEKNIEKSIKWYESAEEQIGLTDPVNEIPSYRLGRLYLVSGDGLKGLEKLRLFTVRFPQSKYLGRAYMAMGDACVQLFNADRAERYYRRVLRVSPELTDVINAKLAELAKVLTSEQWLKMRAQERADLKAESEKKADGEEGVTVEEKAENIDSLTKDDLAGFSAETVYDIFLRENSKMKPDFERSAMFLYEILMRSNVESQLLSRASRQYISTRYFRNKKLDELIKEAGDILIKHNYASWQSDLLFRLARAHDEKKTYEEANKYYFEYLSFFESDARAIDVRQRIPQIYEELKDNKNAYRFYEKLISDSSLKDKIRIDASIRKAMLEISEEKKDEAIKTFESALSFESERRPEICLRLEKLTEDFSYISRALNYSGEEKYRLSALKRLIKKYEEDGDFAGAAGLLKEHTESFESMDAIIYIDRKVDELSKRGVIENIEQLIEQYPEDPRTAERMFRLAKMVEGAENTRYRSEDLFYEITLVYPNSVYFKESKIRAENTQAIQAVTELSDMLKKGAKAGEDEEIVIERAHLLKANLKDLNGAYENYESFISLFPNSKYIDEVYLNLGDMALSIEKNEKKAFSYWEKGLAASNDAFMRESLTERINNLRKDKGSFNELSPEGYQAKSLEEIFKIWRINKNYVYALGLLSNAINRLENRSDVSLLKYYRGRIYEESENYTLAEQEYEGALRSMSNKGARKDMILYRLARLSSVQREEEKAFGWYTALISRYPKSLLSRSAYYWLSKYCEQKEDYNNSYLYMTFLLKYQALHPVHREALQKRKKMIEAKMNVKEMRRLKLLSSGGGTDLPYFIGKVLENDLQDYDQAIEQYQEYLADSPSEGRSREVMLKIANLYEKKGEYVKTVAYLDKLLDSYRPTAANFDVILRIGDLLEDKIKNDELTELFFDSIAAEYKKVRSIRVYAVEKLKRLQEKKYAVAEKAVVRRITKRVYSEEDNEVLEEIKAIKEKYLDDLGDPKQTERQLQDLWEEYPDSLASLDIMKALVDLNMKELMDPQKAADYYYKWLEENRGDPMYTDITLKLYDHYMEVLKDGQRALRLLEDYIKDNPISLETLDIELKVAVANETLVRNFDEALRGYQRIIDTQQNSSVVHEAYYRIGFVYREGYANYAKAIEYWTVLTGNTYYNNEFSDKSQFAIAYTYEAYIRDYTKARAAYNEILNRFPNSSLQNDARTAILRIEGK